MKKLLLTAALAMTMPAVAGATEIVIYTGGGAGSDGSGSTYHEGIGQGVAEFLEDGIADELGYDVRLVPSNGAVDNANKVGATTDRIVLGIGQGGLTYDAVEAGDTQIVRRDLPGECAMAFTAEPRIQSWGDIIANASRVTWVVPENSGSEAFIRKMYEADDNFPGTPTFSYQNDSASIIATVGNPSNRGTVGFFYAYPNPTSGLVNMAAEEDLSIFGVLSPAVAETDEAYYLNRKAPYQLSWFGFGETKTTRAMCSKALLFANDISGITDSWNRADAEMILEAIESAPAEAFVPQGGPLARVMSSVEDLSEEYGVNEMVSDLEAQVQGALDR